MGDWSGTARGQDGCVSLDQLVAAGATKSAVSRLVAAGSLDRVSGGVFLVRGAPLTYRARLNAALLASAGVLGKATAAHLWGMTAIVPEVIDVVLPHDQKVRTAAGVRIHRAVVDPQEWVLRDRLRLTTRTLTALDYIPTLSPRDRRSFTDRALQRGWLDISDFAQHLARYPGRHGNGALRELLPELSGGAAADSERLLHQMLVGADLAGWVANYALWERGELIGVLDVAFPASRLAIEVDGWAYHSDVERFRRDRRKQNAMVAVGWTVLRFTWADLVERPAYVISVVCELLDKLRVISSR